MNLRETIAIDVCKICYRQYAQLRLFDIPGTDFYVGNDLTLPTTLAPLLSLYNPSELSFD